ncbi:hypothetical protein ACXET9_07150 [Brachybacterium sp. DNPG3]
MTTRYGKEKTMTSIYYHFDAYGRAEAAEKRAALWKEAARNLAKKRNASNRTLARMNELRKGAEDRAHAAVRGANEVAVQLDRVRGELEEARKLATGDFTEAARAEAASRYSYADGYASGVTLRQGFVAGVRWASEQLAAQDRPNAVDLRVERAEVWCLGPGAWVVQVFVPGLRGGRSGPIHLRPAGITVYPPDDGLAFPTHAAALAAALAAVRPIPTTQKERNR